MARRVIPVHDWAPAQESMFLSPFDSDEHAAPAGSSQRRSRLRSFSGLSFNSSTTDGKPTRGRSKSATPAPTFDPANNHNGHRDEDSGDSERRPNRDGGDGSGRQLRQHHDSPRHEGARVRNMLRRASISIKGFVHRRTSTVTERIMPAAEDPRPETAHTTWNRLRQATSFRHPRTSHGPESSQSGLDFGDWSFQTPIPGVGAEPPIIPEHSGSAAKAAAAISNEYLALSASRQNVPLSTAFNRWLAAANSEDDGESGIGIGLAGSDVGVDMTSDTTPHDAHDSHISRVDFIAELPVELGVQILSYLDAMQLLSAGLVSRVWHAVGNNCHVWRESFMREKTAMTFATSGPVKPGTGLGVPRVLPTNDWKQIYKAREELDWRWKHGKMKPTYLNGHFDSIYCVQFDEHMIITGSRDKTIRIWDMHTFHCRLVIGPSDVVSRSDFLRDAKGLPTHYAVLEDNERAAESVPAVKSFPIHHNASILCLQYDDKILVTGSSDSTCIMYDMRNGYRPIRRLEHHIFAVLDLAFDDRHIVTCSKDVTICVWDRETGQMLRQLRGHSGPVNSVQMRGNSIVSCSGDSRVKLWNVDTGKNIREFVGHTKGLACSQFSEDCRYVASAGNEKIIRIWDANTGECVHQMRAHEYLVRSLHIDSISGRLVSGSYDADIKVFDLGTGAQLLEFPGWHQSWVLSAKSDYRRIVSTGQDPKILIMDFGGGVPGIEALETTPRPGDEVFFGEGLEGVMGELSLEEKECLSGGVLDVCGEGCV